MKLFLSNPSRVSNLYIFIENDCVGNLMKKKKPTKIRDISFYIFNCTTNVLQNGKLGLTRIFLSFFFFVSYITRIFFFFNENVRLR